MAIAALVDVDYGSRVGVAASLCAAVNALGGTQVGVPSQMGSYDHPSTMINFLRAAAAAVGVAPPTDNLDYSGFVPLGNAIIASVNARSAAPVNTTPPSIAGSAVHGSVLTCTPGVWVPPTATITRQWVRSPSTNVGTGALTYTTVVGDETFNITCVETATTLGGSASSTSNAIGPIT
jgi:hypothetical protein